VWVHNYPVAPLGGIGKIGIFHFPISPSKESHMSKNHSSPTAIVPQSEAEALVVQHALAFYRDMKQHAQNAPFGEFLNYAERFAKMIRTLQLHLQQGGRVPWQVRLPRGFSTWGINGKHIKVLSSLPPKRPVSLIHRPAWEQKTKTTNLPISQHSVITIGRKAK